MAQSPVPATPARPVLRLVLGGHARLSIEIDRQAPVPLADQISGRLAELIRAGTLPHGTRLPSIRALARRTGIGVHSVVEAYARLAAMGLAVSRSGSGVYVIRPAELSPAAPLPTLIPPRPRASPWPCWKRGRMCSARVAACCRRPGRRAPGRAACCPASTGICRRICGAWRRRRVARRSASMSANA
ncbi:GntR family transcriptional regulator [Pseudoroseomonas wenyumeiae]